MEVAKFGKYEVLGQLGEGAMGVVYKAQDPVLKRFVAIKTISASLGGDNDLRQRFEREAQAAAALNHPNIITIHDFGEEKGKIYMAMELLEGEDLKQLITEGRLRELPEKLGIMEQICDGLAFAHAKGIIHRDLKPSNIHVQPNGQVKILDFGLARLGSSEMTRTGVVMGTPNYMSPEQVMGDKVDARSDIFALGTVFYELITNHKPFEADSVHAVLYQVVHKQPQPVRDWAPDTPPILVELVEKALAKDPAARFPNAGALREAVRVVRQAMTSGRLETASLAEVQDLELVDETEVGPVAPAPTPAQGTGPSDQTRPRTGRGSQPPRSYPPRTRPPGAGTVPPASRSASFTPRPIQTSKTPYIVVGGIALAAAIVVGSFLFLRARKPAAPTPPPESTQVGALTQALVQTQLDLAQRVLEDKDYQGAIDQAERALKLDPSNAAAQELVRNARQRLSDLDAAATEARTAFEAGDMQKASEALGQVLALDPKHPVAAELTQKLNQYFQAQADDARSDMERSRASAEQAGAAGSDDFKKAIDLAGDATALLQKQEYAVATQTLLQARDSFDRARRGAEAAAQKAADERAAQQRAASQRATPEPTVAGRPYGETQPATRTVPERPRVAASSAPSPSMAPAPVPPSVTLAPTPPPPPPRAFVPGRTSVIGVSKGGPAGFDMSGMSLAADFKGQMEFEPTPSGVRPGDDYTIKIYLVNNGKKSVKIRNLTAFLRVNGARTPVDLQTGDDNVRAGLKTLVGEVRGRLEAGVKSWSLEVVARSDKGETYKNRLVLQ